VKRLMLLAVLIILGLGFVLPVALGCGGDQEAVRREQARIRACKHSVRTQACQSYGYPGSFDIKSIPGCGVSDDFFCATETGELRLSLDPIEYRDTCPPREEP